MQDRFKGIAACKLKIAAAFSFAVFVGVSGGVASDAFADQDAPAIEDAVQSQMLPNSWRYQDGKVLTSADGASADALNGSISAYSAVWNPSGYTVFNWFDTFDYGYCSGVNAFNVIDVSEHQGYIDWSQVKASGVDYAIIRCGYGNDYYNQDDNRWIQNVQGCIANGIPFGVYLYSYATDTDMAQSEAYHVLRCLSDAGLSPSRVALPIFLDMEDYSTVGSDYAAVASTFCDILS